MKCEYNGCSRTARVRLKSCRTLLCRLHLRQIRTDFRILHSYANKHKSLLMKRYKLRIRKEREESEIKRRSMFLKQAYRV